MFFISFFISAFISWLFLRYLIPILKRTMLDLPNLRSSHLHPTPRGGGISFVLVTYIASILVLISGIEVQVGAFPLFLLPLVLVGILDDRQSLPVFSRYIVQLLTSILVLYFSPIVHELVLESVSVSYASLFLIPMLAISVTALINFTNFMDGLDGLLAGCMTIIIAVLSFLIDAPWSLWALVGSLFAFLLWNWSPAKVFMGDVGSTFLGALFAFLVLQASSWLESLSFLLLATPLLADSTYCLTRRLLAGHRIFDAHRLHLYQRLHAAGLSHRYVSLIYISATLLLSVSLLLGGLSLLLPTVFVLFFVGFILDRFVAVPFLHS